METAAKRQYITLDHLRTLDDGPALAPSDIARIFGYTLSIDKVRDMCEAGQLQGAKVYGRGRIRYRWRVPFVEVRRVFVEIGLLKVA